MYGKPIAQMTVGELGAYLQQLDRTHGPKDPNGIKRQVRLELIRRGKLAEAVGLPLEVLKRNPLIRAEIQEVENERASDDESNVQSSEGGDGGESESGSEG